MFSTINGWAGNRLLDKLMTFTAKDMIFLVFLVFAALIITALRRRAMAAVVGSAVTLLLAFVFGLLAAALHAERRPFQTHHVHLLLAHAPGQSFPSDHATAGFAIALATIAFLSRPVGSVLFVLTAWIGFARVYAGIHYPGDILGALLIAALALPFGLVAARRVPTRAHSQHSRPGPNAPSARVMTPGRDVAKQSQASAT